MKVKWKEHNCIRMEINVKTTTEMIEQNLQKKQSKRQRKCIEL